MLRIIILVYLTIASQFSVAQFIDPYKPSLELDSLYISIQHLDSIFCYNQKGQLEKFQDDYTSICFSNGHFISLKIGDFELSPATESYEVIVMGNDGNKYRFLPELLDINIELDKDSVISLLHEANNYGKSRRSFYRNQGHKIIFDNLIEFDSLKISLEIDASLNLVYSAWVHTGADITLNMGKSLNNKSKFGEFVMGQKDKYVLRIFTDKANVINFIGIEYAGHYNLWFNLRSNRTPNRLMKIDYVIKHEGQQGMNDDFWPYELFSYKRNGRIKKLRIPVRQCTFE